MSKADPQTAEVPALEMPQERFVTIDTVTFRWHGSKESEIPWPLEPSDPWHKRLSEIAQRLKKVKSRTQVTGFDDVLIFEKMPGFFQVTGTTQLQIDSSFLHPDKGFKMNDLEAIFYHEAAHVKYDDPMAGVALATVLAPYGFLSGFAEIYKREPERLTRAIIEAFGSIDAFVSAHTQLLNEEFPKIKPLLENKTISATRSLGTLKGLYDEKHPLNALINSAKAPENRDKSLEFAIKNFAIIMHLAMEEAKQVEHEVQTLSHHHHGNCCKPPVMFTYQDKKLTISEFKSSKKPHITLPQELLNAPQFKTQLAHTLEHFDAAITPPAPTNEAKQALEGLFARIEQEKPALEGLDPLYASYNQAREYRADDFSAFHEEKPRRGHITTGLKNLLKYFEDRADVMGASVDALKRTGTMTHPPLDMRIERSEQMVKRLGSQEFMCGSKCRDQAKAADKVTDDMIKKLQAKPQAAPARGAA